VERDALQPEYSIVAPEWLNLSHSFMTVTSASLNPTYRALELRISYNQW